MEDELELLTPDEVAKKFKVKVDWIYDQVQAGRLPAVRIGGKRTLRFRRADLVAYLEREAGSAEPAHAP